MNFSGDVAVVEGAVDEVHADDAERLLLQHGLLVPHADVQDDVVGRLLGMDLEADAHPAVGLVVALEALGRDGVGEDEEGRAAAARLRPGAPRAGWYSWSSMVIRRSRET